MSYSKKYRRHYSNSVGIPGIPSSFNCLMSNKVYRKKPKWVDKYKKRDNAMIDKYYNSHPGGYSI